MNLSCCRILVVGGKVEQICDVLSDVIRKLEKVKFRF